MRSGMHRRPNATVIANRATKDLRVGCLVVDTSLCPPVGLREVSTISKAIAERHAQIRSLQADIDALQRAKTIR